MGSRAAAASGPVAVAVEETRGRVAEWEDEEDGPGPDWQPRPMGGTRARLPAVESVPGDGYDTAPPDPWGDVTDAHAVSPYASGYSYQPLAPLSPIGHQDGAQTNPAADPSPGDGAQEAPPQPPDLAGGSANTNPDNGGGR
ncbi:MAG: hypothetical protein IVW57_19285 [Ktedonobacterales bacterium]|nr:hypothetical protein [Ktedonobacterales bacterium]